MTLEELTAIDQLRAAVEAYADQPEQTSYYAVLRALNRADSMINPPELTPRHDNGLKPLPCCDFM